MRLFPSFSVCSHAVVLLAILGAAMAQGSLWLLLVAGTLGVAARLVSEGPNPWLISRRWSLGFTSLALIGSIIYIVIDPMMDRVVQGVLMFSIWITIIKLYERHTLENEAERLVLSVLLMSLAAVHGTDLLFGVVLLSWIALGLVVLILLPFQAGSDEFEAAVGVNRSARREVISGPRMRHQRQGAVLLVIVITVLCSGMLFFILPRPEERVLTPVRRAQVHVTGSGIRPDVNLPQELQIFNQGAAVADIVQTDGDPIPSGPLYLRTGTSSRYLGDGKWVPSGHRPSRMRWCPEDEWITLPPKNRSSQVTLSVQLLQQLVYIPVPRGPTRLRAMRSVWVSWDRVGQIIGVESAGQLTSFELQADLLSPAAMMEVDREAWNGPVRELSASLLTAAGLPIDQPDDPAAAQEWRHQAAMTFRTYLEGGAFFYTLDLRSVGSTEATRRMDPVERFLLHEQRGHCEYFASGFVALCQASGIQSRIVTGFLAQGAGQGRWQAFSDDAHAWAEARLSGGVWTRVDPSGARAAEDSGRGLMATLRSFYSAADMFWQLNVVGFTDLTKQQAVSAILPRWQAFMDSIVTGSNNFLAEVDHRFGAGRAGTIWLISVGGIVLLGVVVLVRFIRRRRRARVVSGLPSGSSIRTSDVLFYDELLQHMEAAGFEKPASMPPLTWSRTAISASAELAGLVEQIVEQFYRVRYAQEPLTVESRQRVRTQLQQVQRLLGANR